VAAASDLKSPLETGRVVRQSKGIVKEWLFAVGAVAVAVSELTTG